MRRRFIVLVVGAALGLFAAAFPAAAAPTGANGRPTARLVEVHVFHAAGKPSPTTANCSPDPGTSNGLYALIQRRVAGPLHAHLNLATVPSNVSDARADMQAAFAAWPGVDSAVPTITVDTDGTLTKPAATRTDDLMFGRTQRNAIAVTYTWQWSDGLYESDVIFGNGLRWFEAPSEGTGCYPSQPAYDVQNIATHEFGHVYGLDHSGADRFETMYAYGYTGETLKRSPSVGDSAGVRSLYP